MIVSKIRFIENEFPFFAAENQILSSLAQVMSLAREIFPVVQPQFENRVRELH